MYTYKIKKEPMGQFKTIYWAVYRPAGILGWFEKWQQVPHSTFWNEEQVIDVIVRHKEQNKNE